MQDSRQFVAEPRSGSSLILGWEPIRPVCREGFAPSIRVIECQLASHTLALESTPSRAKAHEKPQRTKLGAMGEYYRAFVVKEEPVTKWPAKRDEVEYDVLRVSVNVRTN